MTSERREGDAAPSSPVPDALNEAAAEHYRRAVELSPIGMICVDGAKGRYVFANERFAQMIGRPRAELLECDPYQISFDVTFPDDRVKSRDAIAKIAQGVTDSAHYEKRLVRSDGAVFWVAADLYAKRDAEGRLAFLTLCFTDIDARYNADSARKLLEDQLRQAQKLEALGRLAGGIAHDFNNFLLLIMGHTELLKNSLPRESPLLSRTELVLGSAQRAGELTRQLLAYSRRQVLKPRVVDLNAIVDHSRRLLERLLGPQVALSTVLGASHTILADAGQVEQVIINLALNGRDAMPAGGRLSLETANVKLAEGESSVLPAGDYVILRVRDTGQGIAPEILPRIFEPFFTTKEVGQGTGLGLAMVEGIVSQSGGEVQVESKPREGTVFTIRLPRARGKLASAEQARAEPASVPRGPHFETVLVCDDDEGVRELIANVLRLRGYAVLEAKHGEHALEVAAAQREPIHLLVTDLVMPELGGIELSQRMRARIPEIKVLYISGFAEQTAYLSGPMEPRTYFMPKPFLPSELTRTVSSILEQAEAREQNAD
jgi:two-component system, cell cycle sensor histidine kinase and response regulator CckA